MFLVVLRNRPPFCLISADFGCAPDQSRTRRHDHSQSVRQRLGPGGQRGPGGLDDFVTGDEKDLRLDARLSEQPAQASGSRLDALTDPAPERRQRGKGGRTGHPKAPRSLLRINCGSVADRESRRDQPQGRQSEGAVVGQTLSSDQAAPATLPSSGLFRRTRVSLESDSFFTSFFFMVSLSCQQSPMERPSWSPRAIDHQIDKTSYSTAGSLRCERKRSLVNRGGEY